MDGTSPSEDKSMTAKFKEWKNSITRWTNHGLQAGEDVLWWLGNNRGVFNVSALYKMMNHSNHQLKIFNWPWKHIWRTKILHKLSGFVWLLAKEAVLTQDNLMKRGYLYVPDVFFVEKQQRKLTT